MTHKLADETLSAILVPLLEVSDDDFQCANPGDAKESPFARIVEHPPANFLAVCKRWMRICTPLLYRTVIIRSQPQAAALAAVLKPKANAPLGKYIRKIRIEGGFGVAVKQILMAAPEVTDICVSLNLHAAANVGPMCDVLATTIRPRRLVIALYNSFWNKSNKQIMRLAETISQCIGSWSTLETVVISDLFFLGGPSWEPIRRAIASCPHLKELSFPSNFGAHYFDHVCQLAREAHVQRVVFEQCPSDIGWYISDAHASLEPELQAKVVFGKKPEASRVSIIAQQIAAQGNPFFTPLSNVTPILRQAIWTLVLRAAFNLTTPRFVGIRMFEPAEDSRATRYMLVNREWLDIVRYLACERVRVSNAIKARGFLHFSKTAKMCSRTTHLTIGRVWPMNVDGGFPDIMFSDLDHFTQLRYFDADLAISSGSLCKLLNASGLSLTSLDVNLVEGTVRIPYMPCLKRLSIAACCDELTLIAVGGNLFPVVDDLKFRDYTVNSDLALFLAGQRLPRLAQLSFDSLGKHTYIYSAPTPPEAAAALEKRTRKFFEQHGAKLEAVTNHSQLYLIKFILSNCPCLVRLDLRNTGGRYLTDAPLPSDINLDSPHDRLEQLVLGQFHADNVTPTDKVVTDWYTFFQAISSETFPKLRTIASCHRNLWPVTLRDAPKHPMTTAAEELMEKGIRLCDDNGVSWKPRLQAKSRKK